MLTLYFCPYPCLNVFLFRAGKISFVSDDYNKESSDLTALYDENETTCVASGSNSYNRLGLNFNQQQLVSSITAHTKYDLSLFQFFVIDFL